MNVLQPAFSTKSGSSRNFHISVTTNRFDVNEARRKQRRKNWRTLAKQLGLNPNMGNATIKKEAQIRGKIPANAFMLQQWEFQKTITPEARKLRKETMRAKIAMLENRPIFEGGRFDVSEAVKSSDLWREEMEIEKLKSMKTFEE